MNKLGILALLALFTIGASAAVDVETDGAWRVEVDGQPVQTAYETYTDALLAAINLAATCDCHTKVSQPDVWVTSWGDLPVDPVDPVDPVIPVDPTLPGGLLVSTDGGNSWDEFYAGMMLPRREVIFWRDAPVTQMFCCWDTGGGHYQAAVRNGPLSVDLAKMPASPGGDYYLLHGYTDADGTRHAEEPYYFGIEGEAPAGDFQAEISLEWEAPTTRTDGMPLDAEELIEYLVRIDIDGQRQPIINVPAPLTRHTMVTDVKGYYTFAVAAVAICGDEDWCASEYSNEQTKVIY